MEFKSNKPRPQPIARTAAAPSEVRSAPQFSHWIKRKTLMIVCVVGSALLVIAGVHLIKKTYFSAEANIQKDRYQALFMANGQLYFGKLSQVEGHYVIMKDVFYLQTQAEAGAPKDVQEAEAQAQVLLTKLGSELQGPEDAMYIQREQVLFWENLRTDSKVVKAIEDFKAKK